MWGVVLILIYPLLLFHYLKNSQDAFGLIGNSSTIAKGEPKVSAVSTGPNVPLVIVGVYHLPSTEPNMTRYRALQETDYGLRSTFGYPIGAQLVSNQSEYTIPSDRTSYQQNDRAFKYFQEMKGLPHLDAKFGKIEHTRFSNAERIIILRGLFAAWYVYSFKMWMLSVFRF